MPTKPAGRWEAYLDRIGDDGRRELLPWYESRPPGVRALIRRFPPGLPVEVRGRPAWVVSYTETDAGPGLSLSHVDPGKDYDGAMADRFYCCADHLPGED